MRKEFLRNENGCINKELAVENLKMIAEKYNHDAEKAHVLADDLLIEFIDDEDIEKAYENIDKWYA